MRRATTAACLAAAFVGLASVQPVLAGEATSGTAAVDGNAFQKVTLNDRPGEPMALAVLPDLRVLHSARTGEIRLHDPASGVNFLAADMKQSPQGLYQHDEEGVQGVAVDPNFAKNKWVYVYYSPRLNTPVDNPATPGVNEGDAPETGTQADWDRYKGALYLSRFKLEGNKLNFSTEQRILEVPVDRGMCCHVGGKIDFDSKGNLYLSTGDDSNPFSSDGYTPIDDRPGRNPVFDARRTSGNTNDLRGKILRIKVAENGSYTIPSGNLFKPGTEKTRPEIYAMGFRNPFRFDVDSKTGDVYVGDYSPDANADNPNRGPSGQGRWMVVDRPANYGWPFCMSRDLAYNDYDFATGTSGPKFNCKKPVNDSRWNTGLTNLPAVTDAEVIYGYGPSEQFPELGTGGIGPMGGPAYRPAKGLTSQVRWPEELAGKPLLGEWTRDWLLAFNIGSNSKVKSIEKILPAGDVTLDGPMDMEFGPDGALYVLDYGTGYFAELPEAQLARIDYTRGNRTPQPKASADVVNGQAPLTVKFSSAGTTDADGDELTYEWDFNADGVVDSTEQNPTHTYTANGTYEATLNVTDETGRSAAWSVRVVVGNTAPVVSITTNPSQHGGTFHWGDTVTYTVTVTDDQPVDCSRVSVSFILGHDTHGHPLSTSTGCTGSFVTFVDGGHAGASNLRAVFNASYTDAPSDGLPALSGSAEVALTPAS
ncbi:PQQ-dependent sugar dehydrogenase [Motilibacter aurantiacus]|uniref:PQQ-dependent sugar dehydrogenase n=1 Tax=Motilibacter aurantiacus TaxID=2714955 RepID=UPI00140A505F|nr:PKD domain-containing protein [Motilibacter aurantiacus]